MPERKLAFSVCVPVVPPRRGPAGWRMIRVPFYLSADLRVASGWTECTIQCLAVYHQADCVPADWAYGSDPMGTVGVPAVRVSQGRRVSREVDDQLPLRWTDSDLRVTVGRTTGDCTGVTVRLYAQPSVSYRLVFDFGLTMEGRSGSTCSAAADAADRVNPSGSCVR